MDTLAREAPPKRMRCATEQISVAGAAERRCQRLRARPDLDLDSSSDSDSDKRTSKTRFINAPHVVASTATAAAAETQLRPTAAYCTPAAEATAAAAQTARERLANRKLCAPKEETVSSRVRSGARKKNGPRSGNTSRSGGGGGGNKALPAEVAFARARPQSGERALPISATRAHSRRQLAPAAANEAARGSARGSAHLANDGVGGGGGEDDAAATQQRRRRRRADH